MSSSSHSTKHSPGHRVLSIDGPLRGKVLKFPVDQITFTTFLDERKTRVIDYEIRTYRVSNKLINIAFSCRPSQVPAAMAAFIFHMIPIFSEVVVDGNTNDV